MIIAYIIIGLIILLFLVRIVMPYIALSVINKFINKTAGIKGTIRSISLNLAAGTYRLKDVEIFKQDDRSGIYTTQVKVDTVEIRIPLVKLIRKKFDGIINIINPEIIAAAVLESSQDKTENVTIPVAVSPLLTSLENVPFIRLDVNVINGKARYINYTTEPNMDVSVLSISIKIKQFSNQPSFDTADIRVTGSVYGGAMSMDMTIKPMREQLTFDLKLELNDADMVQLNPYLKTFANIDVDGGTFALYMEMIAAQGTFRGYMKPMLRDMNVVAKKKPDDSILKYLWEQGVAMLFQLLKNNRTEQVATKIPFEGRLDDPHVHVGAAIAGVLRNAFIKAIKPSFETTFNLESVYKTTKGFIGRLLGREN